MGQELWRIDTLCDKAIAVLQSTQYDGPESARVRELPDVRTIRYYTTVGLLDRCSEMRGRTAYYGRRHLLQLVAIKRLQAQGLSLVEIQQKLVGIKDSALKKLAGVSDEDLAAAPNAAAVESAAVAPAAVDPAAAAPAKRQRFWEELPQTTSEPSHHEGAVNIPRPAVFFPVTSGVSLVLENISPQRLAQVLPALQAALEPLRHVIQQIFQGEPVDTNTLQNEQRAGGTNERPGESRGETV
jgi:DNA-binding transcriptional MerR regulator